MKKSRINPVSAKQKVELQRRKDLKTYLILRYGEKCWKCENKSWLLDLSHKVPLSAGGKTEEDNVEILCRRCHMGRHHQL